MSLTGHLDSTRSPVRRWFEDRLPNTKDVVRDANRTLRDARDAPRLPGGESDPGLVGHAVDFLIRGCLQQDALSRSVALLGGFPSARLAAAADMVHRQVAARFTTTEPWRRRPTPDEWEALCRACLVLAWLERCYRTPVAGQHLAAALTDAGDTLADWEPRLARQPDIEDLALLGRASRADLHDLRNAPTLVCNPTFELSTALGGADADLIADHLLLELKSTRDTSVMRRTDVWQLVGYALADTHDEHGITAVGLAALRWRTRVAWPLDALLEQLAGKPVTLAGLRAEFAALLEPYQRPRQRHPPRRA